MAKKCEKCGAPIEGFFSYISRIMGVKKSKSNPNLCSKCAPGEGEAKHEETKAEEPKPEATQPEAPTPAQPTPPVEEKKETPPQVEFKPEGPIEEKKEEM